MILNKKQMRGPEAKPFIRSVEFKQTVFSGWGKVWQLRERTTAHISLVGPKAFSSLPWLLPLWEHSTTGQSGSPTFPWATSSLWAAEADLTRALVAAAMDLAASKICSSKSKVSSACYNQKKTMSYAIHIHQGFFLPDYLLLCHLALPLSIAFCGQTTAQKKGLSSQEASPSAAVPVSPPPSTSEGKSH